jgi:hypothetical protein
VDVSPLAPVKLELLGGADAGVPSLVGVDRGVLLRLAAGGGRR